MTRPARIPKTMPIYNRRRSERRVDHHLRWLKTLPCLGCGRAPPCDPAHLRFATADEPLKPGIGLKPPDWRAVGLCRRCHDKEERGKLTFWAACMSIGISDPIAVAGQLWRVSGDTPAGYRAIQHARPGLRTAMLEAA